MSMAGLIPGGAAYVPMSWPTGQSGASSSTISAAGHQFAVLVQALSAGNIRKIRFRTSTVTTGATVRASIQGISGTTGDPDGTIANSGNSSATVSVADTDDNTWKTTADFTTDYTVANGDRFFVVLDFPSTPGNMQISRSTAGGPNNFNYVDVYATSWTKTSSTANVLLEQSDGTFLPCIGIYPMLASSNVNFNSSSNPNQRALRFVYDVPVRLWGVWFWSNNFSGDAEFILYEGGGASDTTPLATTAEQDKDVKHSSSTQPCYFQFATPVDLTAGTVYRLALTPTTTTNVGYTAPNAAVSNASLAALGNGTEWYSSTRNGGNWTDATDTPAAIFPVVSGADNGANNIFIARRRVA